MSDLAGVLGRVRVLLQDEHALNYTDGELTEAVRLALQEYNARAPALSAGVATLAAKGWEVDLSALAEICAVYTVRWPWDALLSEGDQAENQVVGFSFHLIGDKPTLLLSTQPGAVPDEGEGVWVLYGTAHALKDLDGALSTTGQLSLDLLVLGAAGLASASEVSDRGELLKPKDLRESGNFWLAEFRGGLGRIEASRSAWPANTRPGPGASLPGVGWSVDRWDRGAVNGF